MSSRGPNKLLTHRNFAGSSSVAALIRTYGDHKVLSQGQRLHAHVLMLGYGDDDAHQICFLENLLIQMYGKCGSMDDAISVFSNIHETDQFSWNLFLGACIQNNEIHKAFHHFHQMQTQGLLPNKHTFLHILAACAGHNAISKGKLMHALTLSTGLVSDLVLECAIVNMYGKCGDVYEARKMFNRMSDHNVISWNAMISAYAQQGQSSNALVLFWKMLQQGFEPSKVTFVSLLDACASDFMIDEAMLMHAYIASSSLEADSVVGTSLVNIYGKCGSMNEALYMFRKIPVKNVVTWNAMIGVCAFHGQGNDSFKLFKEMNLAGIIPNRSTFVSMLSACAMLEALVDGRYVHSCMIRSGITCDVVLATALVSMYGKCASLKDARVTFDEMVTSDAVAWTAMFAAYVQQGESKEALSLIPKMPSGPFLADNVTFVSILDACATEGAIAEGQLIHALVLDSKFECDTVVGTALLNMYSKCANLEDAWNVFNIISERDVVAWNAMIAAYGQHGHVKVALELFYQMLLSVVPDEITFICVLTACSHAGMINDVDQWFHFMQTFRGISPSIDHCNCLLDLFGRSGWIDKCKHLILSMPFQPSTTSWMTMLSACRTHLNVLGGEHAAAHIFETEGEFPAPYVVLSNLYSVTGQLDAADRIRKMMKCKNTSSMIEIDV